MSRSSRRYSINDIKLPTNLMKGLSIQVLKELSKQDDATFYQYFEGLNLEVVKTTREKSQQLRDANKELAVTNLELEPKFSEMKTQLLERTSELSTLKEEYDRRLLELKAIQNKTNHQAVEKELAQATRKIEQESDDFAADFIGGKSSLSLEEFQEQFLKERTLFWLRKVKSEKMKELLQNYRPIPAPRTVHSIGSTTPTSTNSTPPYPIPMQSLPPKHQSPGYPMSQPTASLPPYPAHRQMPSPQNPAKPFPAAAYAPYPNAAPPARPPPYTGSRFNQHRY